MKFEDPRFILVNVAIGVLCALLHAPLYVVLLCCTFIGLLTVPPFTLMQAKGFWGSYHPSSFPLLIVILKDESTLPVQKIRVVGLALVLFACCAGLFGLVMAEALLPRVSGFEPLGRPFAPVAITMLCVYGLFRTLIWWARGKQIAR